MEQFLYLSANLKNAKLGVRLDNPPPSEVCQQLFNFSHLISSSIYAYSPVNYEKISVVAPKVSKPGDLAAVLKTFTPSKILELAKPAITLALPQPTDESEVKKWKEKSRALEEMAVCAFLHAVFSQVFPQNFKAIGNPSQQEVRIAANLTSWQAVKKVNCQKAEDKEIFAALVAMYHTIHAKMPAFVPSLKTTGEAHKSYSNLLANLSATQLPLDAMQAEWTVFETMNAAGFPPIPPTQVIGELYPELKIPKPRGNFGKKK